MVRTTYGAYGYFGGDEVFNALRDELLQEFSQSSRETFANLEIMQAFADKLTTVITDSHFMVGINRIVAERMRTYYVPNLYFDDPSGLPEELVKPTIGPEGQITCCLAALSTDGKDLPETLNLNGIERELNWIHANPDRYSPLTAYERTEQEGITFMTSRTLMRTESTADGLDALALSGGEYRDVSPLVIDLRGNGGGNSNYALQWLTGYLREPVEWKVLHYQRNSPLFRAMLGSSDIYLPEFISSFFDPEKRLGWKTEMDGVWKDNDNMIFVLVDENVGSSGEDFMAMLRSVDRVLFVGSNTSGTHISGNIFIGFLPNSGIPVQFATALGFSENIADLDGVGYIPDLWVPPIDADDAVIRLCQYYGLTSLS